jgi:hypothetical protein
MVVSIYIYWRESGVLLSSVIFVEEKSERGKKGRLLFLSNKYKMIVVEPEKN